MNTKTPEEKITELLDGHGIEASWGPNSISTRILNLLKQERLKISQLEKQVGILKNILQKIIKDSYDVVNAVSPAKQALQSLEEK